MTGMQAKYIGGLWRYQKLKYPKSVTLTEEADAVRVVQKVDISFRSPGKRSIAMFR